jgi:hypothetical protein
MRSEFNGKHKFKRHVIREIGNIINRDHYWNSQGIGSTTPNIYRISQEER